MRNIPFAGRYEGAGRWYDEAGKTMTYVIAQTNTVTPAGFDIQFKHDFADGSVVDARFAMVWIDDQLFRLSLGGRPMGHGF